MAESSAREPDYFYPFHYSGQAWHFLSSVGWQAESRESCSEELCKQALAPECVPGASADRSSVEDGAVSEADSREAAVALEEGSPAAAEALEEAGPQAAGRKQVEANPSGLAEAEMIL